MINGLMQKRWLNKLFFSFVVVFSWALFVPNTTHAQCPVASFSIPDTVCIGENIEIVDNSIDAVSYEWDFCAGNLDTIPTVHTLPSVYGSGLAMDFEVIQDSVGNWYGFAVERMSSTLIRLEFGNDLLNPTPTIVDMGNPGGLLSNPDRIKIIYQNSKWYALITNDKTPYHLIKIDFDDSLTAIKSANSLGNFNNKLKRPRGIDAIISNDSLIVVLANQENNRLFIINFGNSINNPITNANTILTTPVIDANGLQDMKLVHDCNQWYGFTVSIDNSNIHRIDFGNSLFQHPSGYTSLVTSEPFTRPLSIDVLHDGVDYRAFIGESSGELIRLDFDNNLANSSPSFNNLGNLSVMSSLRSIAFARFNNDWIAFAVNSNTREVYRLDFINSCSANMMSSSLQNPDSLFYQVPGTFYIGLNVLNEQGNSKRTGKKIVVKNASSPGIDFNLSASRCVSSDISFISSSPDEADIMRYDWDFGDNESDTGKVVTHQYVEQGEYEIKLSVTSFNGCTNHLTDSLIVYNDLGFDLSQSVICTPSEINFINSNQGVATDTITWNWNFNEEGISNDKNPTFIFNSGGDKTVTLSANIPGCAATYDTTFTVFEGPAVDFAFEDQCEGEAGLFENQTTGSNITQYQWDFGDGNTYSSATMASPEHMFEAPGEYEVSLTVYDAQGCENGVVQTFRSFANPKAAFTAELSCAGTPTLFTDETQIDISANVVMWNWDFGDNSPGATIKNPAHTFSSPGTYAVQLLAETNEGCVDAVTQQLMVETPVQPGFEAIKICPSEALDVQLNDTSLVTGEEAVTQWLWQVEDEIYQTQNPVHTFAAPGEYTVSLTATASSLCNASVTRTVTVLPLPEADFSFAQACANDAVAFTDQSAYPESIAHYQWDFGGLGTSTEAHPAFAFEEAGSYPIALMIEDIHGCTDTLTQSIDILPQPVAGFTVENTTGAAPFVVSFDNTSTDASQYQWNFAGLDTSTAISPTFTFEEVGTYPVQLAVANAIGCADTLLRTFTVVQPVFNVSLDNITLQAAANGGAGTHIILTVSNPGTLPVQGFHVAVEIDNQLALERNFGSTLAPGGTLNFPLGVAFSQINHAEQNTRYVCATLTPLEDNFAEAEKGDNIF